MNMPSNGAWALPHTCLWWWLGVALGAFLSFRDQKVSLDDLLLLLFLNVSLDFLDVPF